MPNWKKLIVSGSDATLNSINVISTGSFGDDITITSGSFRIETFSEGFRFYNGSNYTSNSITLSSAQNMQFRAGGVFQFYKNVQLLASKQLVINNSVNDNNISLLNTGATGHSKLEFQDNSNNILAFISSSGNVGIGTATSSQKLRVQGNFRVDSGFLLVSNGAGNTTEYLYHNPTSKAVELNVTSSNTTYDPQYLIRQDNVIKAQFGWDDDGGNELFIVNAANGPIQFKNSSTELARITNSGNLGIGVTNPGRKLHISGSGGTIAAKIQAGDGNQASLDLTNSEGAFRIISDGGALDFYDDTDSKSTFRLKTNQQIQIGEYGAGNFTGTATQRLAVDSSGNVIEVPIGAGAVDGSGAANKVAIWSDADTLTSDNLLHWDSTNDRLGVGLSSPNFTIHIPDGSSNAAPDHAIAIGDDADIKLYRHSNTGVNAIEGLNGLNLRSNTLTFQNQAGTETLFKAIADGGFEGYFNNIKEFEITGSSASDTFVKIYHKSIIQNAGNTNAGYWLYGTHAHGFVSNANGDLRILGLTPGGQKEILRSYITTANRLVIDGNNYYNVGIGSTAPSEKLDVTGNILVSGTAGIGTNSADRALHVEHSDDTVALFESTDTISRIEIKDDVDSSYFGTRNGTTFLGSNLAGTGNENLKINAAGQIAIGMSPSVQYGFGMRRNLTLADEGRSGYYVNFDLTGNTTLTGDRVYSGYALDMDSTATGGNQTQELILRGLNFNIRDTGDANDIYGAYIDVIGSKSTANDTQNQLNGAYFRTLAQHTAGEIQNIRGVLGNVTVNGATSTTAITNAHGVRGEFILNGASTTNVQNAYAGFFKADLPVQTSGTGTVTGTMYGVYGEVESDSTTSLSNARAIAGFIDANSGSKWVNAYQFYGSSTVHSDATINNHWGIYSIGASKHRLDGKLGIGTSDPERTLHVRHTDAVSSKFEGTSATGHLLDLVHDNAAAAYNGLRFFDRTTSRMALTHIQTGTRGYVQIGNNWATGNEIFVVDGDNERVGIGTITPLAQLHATGNTLIGGYLRVQNASSNKALTLTAEVSGNARMLAHNINLNQDQNLDIVASQIDLKVGSVSGGTNASALTLTSKGSASFAGNVTVDGMLTAQEFHTEFVSASIIYDSGSTKFGDTHDDVHAFTGSVNIFSGSLSLTPAFQNVNGVLKIIHGPYAGSAVSHLVAQNTGSQRHFDLTTDANNHTDLRLYRAGTLAVQLGTYWPAFINNGGYSTRGGLLIGSAAQTSNYYGLKVEKGGTSGSLNVADVLYVTGSTVSSVGIGTNAPEDKLTVMGDVRIRNQSGSNPADAGSLTFAETGGTYGSGLYGFRIHQQGDNNRLHFQSSANTSTLDNILVLERDTGEIGIGIANPSEKLDVVGDIKVSNTYGTVKVIGTGGLSRVFLGDTADEDVGYLEYNHISNYFRVGVNAAERMRITSSGDIFINRTSQLGSAKLSIQTDAGEDAIGIQANSNNTTTKVLNVFNSSGVDIASLTVNNDSTPDMLFNVDDGSGTITEVLKLDSSQNAIFAGNVGINVTNPDKRLKVNGQTQFYEYSGAHLTNNAHSTYNFDTLVTNSSATNGGGIGAYVKLAAGATNNSLGDFNAIRTRAYAENTTVNVNSLINFYAEFRNFTSTNSVTLGNHYGLKVDTLGVGGNATVTNNYGVYLNPGTAATNNYGVFQVGASVKNRFNGKVGIGEDPAVSLHVVSSDEVVAKFKSSDNKAAIEISDDDTTGYVSAENGRISIGPQQGLNVQNLNILTSNYKVGVGTATPGRALHAYHATENEVLRLESGDPGAYIQFKDNNSDFQPAIGAIGNNLQFRASGSQIAKFDIDGNLRLGSDTGTIRARLHLSGSSAADAGIRQSRDGVKIWTQEIDNNGKLQWAYRATEAGSATQHFTLNDTGQAILHQYGSGNFTGTAAFNLQLDSSGNLIETAAGGSGTVDGSGSGSRVAIWSDADSITSDSGFTFDGTELLVEDTIVIQRAGVTAGSSSFQQTGTGLILNAPSGYHPLVIKHAGSELFRFKNDGRLGIGTTTPDHQLHIEFANTDTTFSGGGNGAWGSEGIRIENTSGTANTMAMLQFRNSDADIHIAGIRRGTDDSDLGFFFEGDEKVRFTNDGLVGIGTTDPIFTLDVRGDIGTDRYIRHNGDSNTYFGFSGADTIQFNTAGGERMRIASNGNVGIGTTSPGAKMHVVQSAVNTQAVRVDDGTSFVSFVPSLGSGGYTGISNAGDIGLIFSIDGDNTTDTTNGLLIAPHTQTSGGLKILENGNVGIGVATPGARLQVNGSTSDTSANAFIARNSSGTSLFSVRNDGRVDVPSGAIVHAGGGYANTSTNDSYFTGDLGIGTTAPAHKLDISSTGTAMARIISSDGGTARFDLHSSGNSRYSLSALASNGFLLFDEVESDTAVRYFGGSSGKWIFRTNNLERFNIESDGQIKLNTYGTATHTGTATKTLQVDSSGNIIEGSIVNFAPKVEYQTVAANIAANTTITLPNSLTYTISSGGYEYLEVFIDGIRLMRDIDFEEISTSSIKLLMAVPASSVFTFKSIT